MGAAVRRAHPLSLRMMSVSAAICWIPCSARSHRDTIPPVKGGGIHWGTGHPTNNKSESLAISVLIWNSAKFCCVPSWRTRRYKVQLPR